MLNESEKCAVVQLRLTDFARALVLCHLYVGFSCGNFNMDDSADSAKDLFITQSNFRLDTNTQDAEEAANFFLDDNYDPAAPEVIRYLDFSNDTDGTYTIMTESQSQQMHKEKDSLTIDDAAPFISSDKEKENKVCEHFELIHCNVSCSTFCHVYN